MRAGAQMVKLEGGEWLADTVRFLVERSIPVCAHVGLTPQSVHAFGGFKVQGKTDAGASQVLRDALAVQNAGAQLIVMKRFPRCSAVKSRSNCGFRRSASARAGLLGSGAGAARHAGNFPGKRPRFVKDFMQGQPNIQAAWKRMCVREGRLVPGAGAHVLSARPASGSC
jgi:Ketopantoate hydroxymethyltransferase